MVNVKFQCSQISETRKTQNFLGRNPQTPITEGGVPLSPPPPLPEKKSDFSPTPPPGRRPSGSASVLRHLGNNDPYNYVRQIHLIFQTHSHRSA